MMPRGGKDVGKPVEPLFPRLHIDDINDAVKEGPRPPPRNKMALCEQYNAPSQPLFPKVHDFNDAVKGEPRPPPKNKTILSEQYNTRPQTPNFSSESMAMVSVRHGSVPRSFSCQVGGPQHNVPPTFSSLPGSSHLVARDRSCYSTGVSSKTLPKNSETRMRELTKECNSSASHGFDICYMRRPECKNDFGIPSYGRPGTSGSHGDLQLNMDKERLNAFSSVSSKIRVGTDSAPVAGNTVIQVDNKAIKPINHDKKHVPVDESIRLVVTDDTPEMSERTKRKRCTSEMDILLHSFPRLRESIKIETTEDFSEDKGCVHMQGENADKNQETFNHSASESTPIQGITPDDVMAIIGEKLYWKARSRMIHQQRTFAGQIFELHQLVKIQRLIARSPEVLFENNFNLSKSSTRYPQKDKLLYATHMDTSPLVTKPKVDRLKLPPDKDHGAGGVSYMLPPRIPNAEKRHLTVESTRKLSPLPSATTAPWGNQWLVPVRSPSEGLIYKLYSGSCPPPLGIMAPILGQCGPISLSTSLSTVGGTTYGVPAPDSLGIGQSYFQPFVPLNPSGPFPDLKQTIPFDRKYSSSFGSNLAIPCQSEAQGSSGSSPAEPISGDALSLFPMTPSSSVQVSQDRGNEQSVQVIKVVPHNPKAAPESAARIFQSIQEERKNR